MALKMVKGNLERMFDKNLTDLVRGIRNNKDNEAKYIAQCIEEIKQELRQDNVGVKSNAVAKLTYLQMCGYDISWAGFNIIEVMSSNRFTCKRIGYLAASQCFHPDSDLLMLTTNMIRKDLSSTNQYDAGVALSGLSCFISTDLSRDLANDIMTLMSSTKPYLRMKAVLMMYKVFLRYPEALRPAFPKLKEKLEDPDPSVQSAAVNVICELARKNPKNYLSLAPIFFKLMTTSTNNWMLIKIIKLFASLTAIEPALGKKLTHPLIELISSTSAMSLLYECINTVIAVLISISSGMPNHSASIQLCVQKLRILIEDSDQNLKYLGLLAMSKILKTHPKSVQTHKDLILACLDDKDESIRLRALDLLYGMVSKKNLMEIVRRLLGHMERAEGSSYRDELLYKVIEICSQGSYQYVTNFEWYLTVLVELILLESGSRHGRLIAGQLLDVAIRVQAVRAFAVNEMATLLETYPVTAAPNGGTMQEVLYAAAWIVGEFASHVDAPERTLAVLLQPKPVAGHIQAVYVQNALKLFAHLVGEAVRQRDVPAIDRHCRTLHDGLRSYLSSADIEVQERASSVYFLVALLRESLGGRSETTDDAAVGGLVELTADGDGTTGEGALAPAPPPPPSPPDTAWQEIEQIAGDLRELFASELNPVAPKAQRKVQLPDGLDLDEWINQPPPPTSGDASSADGGSSDDEKRFPLFLAETGGRGGGAGDRETNGGGGGSRSYKRVEYTQEELDKMRQARLLEQTNNPNYLKPAKTKASGGDYQQQPNDGYDDIPIAEIALEVPLQIHSTKRSDKYLLEADRRSGGKGVGSSRKAAKGEGAAPSGSRTGKSKRHGKKSKRYADESDTESDDPKPLHVVNTVIELPEGAILSDTEDKNNADPNDPHRALDIDLDAPFEDDYPASEVKRTKQHSVMLLRDDKPPTVDRKAAAMAVANSSRSSTTPDGENKAKKKKKKKEEGKRKPEVQEDPAAPAMMLMIGEEEEEQGRAGQEDEAAKRRKKSGRRAKEERKGKADPSEIEADEADEKKKRHGKKSSKHHAHHHHHHNHHRQGVVEPQKAGYEEVQQGGGGALI
uniref:AP-3 complex subunit delta n=1 Tax=Anopheles farauti TaxID=69004 RepID=A0A182Q5E6_9DIPT